MLWFLMCVAILIGGYFTYGKFVESTFGPSPQRQTPAVTMSDGVDYVEMSNKKVYLIQLLNIAGLGPIFGPILGALSRRDKILYFSVIMIILLYKYSGWDHVKSIQNPYLSNTRSS